MTLRIATYNIRKCLGTDRRRDAQRTLRVIERLDADIVMLQEADMRLGHRPPAFSPHLLQAATFAQSASIWACCADHAARN